MKAVVTYGTGQPLVIEERPDPAPGPGEVLLKVERCGVCGSELHRDEGAPRAFPQGLIMGHEFAGTVAALGAGVDHLRVGQRVAIYPAVGCGDCAACRVDNGILCMTARRVMGGFAEYAVLPAAAAIPLHDALGAADGALVEPLAVSIYGVRLAALRPGDRVLVVGAGTIALTAIYWARRLGAGRIVAMSRSARRADMALRMGADAFVAFGEHEAEEVTDALGGAPDVVFECVGAPGMIGKSIALSAQFGRVLSLGIGSEPDPIVPVLAGMRGVTLQFPIGYSRQEFAYVAQTMLDGHVDPKVMITGTVAMPEFPAMFDHLLGANMHSKVMLAPWGSVA